MRRRKRKRKRNKGRRKEEMKTQSVRKMRGCKKRKKEKKEEENKKPLFKRGKRWLGKKPMDVGCKMKFFYFLEANSVSRPATNLPVHCV